MDIKEFHLEIQRTFIEYMTKSFNDQDEFENIAMECANKVVDIALEVERPLKSKARVKWVEVEPVIRELNKLLEPLNTRLLANTAMEDVISIFVVGAPPE